MCGGGGSDIQPEWEKALLYVRIECSIFCIFRWCTGFANARNPGAERSFAPCAQCCFAAICFSIALCTPFYRRRCVSRQSFPTRPILQFRSFCWGQKDSCTAGRPIQGLWQFFSTIWPCLWREDLCIALIRPEISISPSAMAHCMCADLRPLVRRHTALKEASLLFYWWLHGLRFPAHGGRSGTDADFISCWMRLP